MDTIFIGELSLDGNIEKINGILPICMEAKKIGIKKIIVPKQNEEEASILKGIEILPVSNLKEVIAYLNNEKEIKETTRKETKINQNAMYEFDFSEVKRTRKCKKSFRSSS